MRRLPALLFLLACEPQSPFVCGPVPQLTVLVGERAEARLCFEDPEGAQLDLATSIGDTVVVQAQVTRLGQLSVQGRWPGATTVTVTATDPDGLGVGVAVPVLVPNRLPVGSLDDFEIPARFRPAIDLSRHFSDPDGQPLTYSASSAAPSVVDVDLLSGSLLRLRPLQGDGSAQISVTVSDAVDTVTTTFEATIVPTLLLVSDEFDSAASLDDWTPGNNSDAKIEDGYLVLTVDSAHYIGRVGQELGGTASDWLVDITLRTTEADAQAGFLVATGQYPIGAYMFLLGEADVVGLPPVNWVFMWWDERSGGGWVTDDWAYGKSGHVRDFADMEVSLAMMRGSVRATVNGKHLFELHGQGLLPRATGLFLVTRPEYTADVASSMSRVQFFARRFVEGGSPNALAWPGKADWHIMRRGAGGPPALSTRIDKMATRVYIGPARDRTTIHTPPGYSSTPR